MTRAKTSVTSPLIEWGVGTRALDNGAVSGDLHVIAPFPGGVLAAVIDGLGHGPEAATAAVAAAQVLQSYPDEDLTLLLKRCHEALRSTRGVVLSAACIRAADHTMSWAGIGNVEGVLYRADSAAKPAREALLLRGGVVGYQIPPLREVVLGIRAGDMLLLATDGIGYHFSNLSPIGQDPQDVADDILTRYGKRTDDALVLAVRYLAGPA